MTLSKLNVAYSYSWHLPSSDLVTVQRIMEQLRAYCIELRCEAVGELSVKPDSVQFTAVVPDAGQHNFVLMFSPERKSWSASSWLRVRSFKEIGEIMHHAASLGIFVGTTFAGMVMEYKRNAEGEIEVEQRPAFDLDAF